MSTHERRGVTVVTYQFKIDDDLWEEWKKTVPRSKSLDTRLRELIKADRDGRVLDADHDAGTATEEYYDRVDDVVSERSVVNEIASSWEVSGDVLEQRRAAAQAALELIRQRGSLSKQEAQDELLPEYAVETQGERIWYDKTVKPVLEAVATYSASERRWKHEPEA